MQLVLLRHGETNWNAEQRYQGRSDTALNPRGIAQAQEALERWLETSFDIVVSSPLQRAHRTAQLVTEGRDVDIQLNHELVETHGGHWESLTFSEIKTQWPEIFTQWRGSNRDVGPVGGETPRQAGLRTSSAIRTSLQTLTPSSMLVVGHGSALRAAAAELAGLNDLDYLDLRRLDNGRAHVLTSDNGGAGHWNIVQENV